MSIQSLTSLAAKEVILNSIKTVYDAYPNRKLNLLELGCAYGGTAKSVLDYLDGLGRYQANVVYYGIDIGHLIPVPEFDDPRFHFIKNFTCTPAAWATLPNVLHWIFVDACHCEECCAVDTILYSYKLAPKGQMLFNEARASSASSQAYPELTTIHSAESAAKGTAVRQVLDKLNMGTLRLRKVPTKSSAIEVYEKIGQSNTSPYNPREITLNVVQGIGDIFWIYQKISPFIDKVNFNILVTKDEMIQRRSYEWLSLLPKVKDVECRKVHFKDYDRVSRMRLPIQHVLDQWKAGVTDIEYSCNRWLEEGVRIEDIDPKLPIEINVDIKSKSHKLPYQRYVLVYVSSSAKQLEPQKLGTWPIEEWVQLIDGIYNKYRIRLPIIVIGAEFDRNAVYDVTEHLEAKCYDVTAFIQQPAAKVVHMIKNCELFLGYQSGLNIIADNFNIKQVMLYYQHLEPMMNTWCKKENFETVHFTALFKEKADSIVKRLPADWIKV